MTGSSKIKDSIVSFDSEPLILVDEYDREIGYQDKLACHTGQGVLHRAFSIFIFNNNGDVLLQQRSLSKLLWPLYWSNSCCSHPRKGESMEEAVNRRLQQELGFTTELRYIYKFIYQVPYLDVGAEHELCSVFIGQSEQPILANENEIASWRYISGLELEEEIQKKPEQFTPWFKLEWKYLKENYRDELEALRVKLL